MEEMGLQYKGFCGWEYALFFFLRGIFFITMVASHFGQLWGPSVKYQAVACRTLPTILWSRVLLEKLPGSQQAKKFPAFYGT
jgi:hypothetical protein